MSSVETILPLIGFALLSLGDAARVGADNPPASAPTTTAAPTTAPAIAQAAPLEPLPEGIAAADPGGSLWIYWLCGPQSSGAPGVFVVHRRDGDVERPAVIRYDVRGPMRNGVDVQSLSKRVVIPPGQWVTWVHVMPIDDPPPGRGTSISIELSPEETKP